VISFLSLGFASFEMFFTERVFEEKDAPAYKFLWNIGSLSYLDALTSVIIITLGFAFGRELEWKGMEGEFRGIGIAGVVLAILIIVGLCKLAQILTKCRDILKIERDNMETLNEEVIQKLNLSSLTSWIVSTVIVKNKMKKWDPDTGDLKTTTIKIQLISLIISVIIYIIIHAILIICLCNIELSQPEDFSIVTCIPRNQSLMITEYEEIKIFFGSYDGMMFKTNSTLNHYVRICGENEYPTYALICYIIPVLIVCHLIRLLTGWRLSYFSDFEKLFKKHIYYIDAIEDPLKYKNDLHKWLHENPEFINKPDRTNGRTMLHALQPDIMKELIRGDEEKEAYDEFLKLYIKGGQCDLMDYQSKTAISHWEEEDLPPLPSDDDLMDDSSYWTDGRVADLRYGLVSCTSYLCCLPLPYVSPFQAEPPRLADLCRAVLGEASGSFKAVECSDMRPNTPDTIVLVEDSDAGPRSSPFNDSWVNFSDEGGMQWNSDAGPHSSPFNDSWVDFSDSTVFVVSLFRFYCAYIQ